MQSQFQNHQLNTLTEHPSRDSGNEVVRQKQLSIALIYANIDIDFHRGTR